MAKKAKKTTKAGKVTAKHRKVAAHPGTSAMLARIGGCNLPPIRWSKDGDQWMEMFLKSDCTYGNPEVVDASEVPANIRNGNP
jgi:hypothetical protein